jgi:hypothetical protein
MSTLLEKKLQGTDWQIGDAADFLQLSAEESALIDIRLSQLRRQSNRGYSTRCPKPNWPSA